MTILSNLWANIQIFISNYTYYFGAATNITLAVVFAVFIILGTLRTAKLPRSPKKRGEINYTAPQPEITAAACASLSKAVKIKTEYGEKEELDKLLAFLKTRYKNVFEKCRCTVMPSGSVIISVKSSGGTDKAPVLMLGHLDVVPAEGEWAKDPFSGFDDGNFIWGRGTLDGKNVVIAQLEALEELIKEGFKPKRDLYLAYGSDEETGGEQGAKKMTEIFEKKKIHFEFILDEGGIVSSAHMGNKLFPAASVCVAEKASANIKLTAKGIGGRATEPERKQAIGVLAEAICRIENVPMRRKLLPCVERYLKLSSPSLNYVQRFCLANNHILRHFLYRSFKNDSKVSALFRTTLAATQIKGAQSLNVMPDKAVCNINVRLIKGDSIEKVVEHIKSLIGDLPIDLEIVNKSCPSKVSDTNTEGFEIIRKTIEKHFGAIAVLPSMETGGKDAKYYERLADNVYRFAPFMVTPKQIQSIHGKDENIKKDAMGVAVEYYKSFISAL